MRGPSGIRGLAAVAALGVLLLIAPAPACAEEPEYPAKTRFFRPFARTGIGFALGEKGSGEGADERLGGELSGGLALTSTTLEPAEILVTGGYRSVADGGERALGVPFLGAGAGYRLTLGDLVGLLPAAGVNLSMPVTGGDPELAPELFAETTARLHLYDRNFLTLHAGLSVPVSSPAAPSLTLGFGLERSHPVMVPLPEVEPTLDVRPERFSPDGDGENDILEVGIGTEAERAVASWTLRIYDPRSHLFHEESGEGAPPELITWNGRGDTGELVSSASDYTVELAVADRVGRTDVLRKEVLVDILVTREDGKLKIRIPSITFPPNSADFALLTDEETIEKNQEVLEELADIFSTFPEYSILIEGHANMQYYDDPERGRREQEEVLIPLSRQRAEAVKERLVDLGIERERITAVGIGAESPLVPFSDEENRWKNRRVEFILVRPSDQAEGNRETTR